MTWYQSDNKGYFIIQIRQENIYLYHLYTYTNIYFIYTDLFEALSWKFILSRTYVEWIMIKNVSQQIF